MRFARAFSSVAGVLCGCTLGGVNALPPVDGGGVADGEPLTSVDAGAPDAPACAAGADTDGDGLADCDELGDGSDATDPAVFNGMHAAIGERPEWTGSCDALDDYAEMESRFAAPMQAQDVYAGWEFETGADRYDDASYGFEPNWPTAADGRFSVRYSGRLFVTEAGRHCFSIDIGAAGTDIFTGKNMCGQIYIDGGSAPFVETGFSAAAADAHTACAELAAGPHALDIVFWYFNVLETAKLVVRRCSGGAADCAPDAPIAAAEVQAGL